MTPREYYRESEAAQQRWKDEREHGIVMAWKSAVFYAQAMVGKLPSLENALADGRGETGQTVEQQLASLTTLSKTTGFPLRPASPETLAKLRPMRES